MSNRRVGFECEGRRILVRGTPPNEVVNAIDCNAQFDSYKTMIDWLDRVWPDWRDNDPEFIND